MTAPIRSFLSDSAHIFLQTQMSDGIASIVAESALQLGYTSVKYKEEAVKGFLDGRDMFVALATGFGKSLCYSLLPPVFNRLHGRSSQDRRGSIVIVVSPFLALMKDQVASLEKQGLRAECLCVGE